MNEKEYVDALFNSEDDGPFNIFKCGLESHRQELMMLLEQDVEFCQICMQVVDFFYRPVEEQTDRDAIDLLFFHIQQYMDNRPWDAWGCFFYVLVCFRTKHVILAREVLIHAWKNHLIQMHHGLFFQYAVFLLLDTGNFTAAIRALSMRNSSGCWTYAIKELVYYNETAERRLELLSYFHMEPQLKVKPMLSKKHKATIRMKKIYQCGVV